MKKFLSVLTISCVLSFSASQVLACGTKPAPSPSPTPVVNSKSALSGASYFESSTQDFTSQAIHSINKLDLPTLKNAVYNFVLNKYNAQPSKKGKQITIEDVKNDISVNVYVQTNNKWVIATNNISDFTNYEISLIANENAKYFAGSNNKDNFLVDLTQLDLKNFKLNQKVFQNKSQSEIKNRIEQNIVNWYVSQEKDKQGHNKSGYVPFDLNKLNKDKNINISFPKNLGSSQMLSLNYAVNKNDEFFAQTSGAINNINAEYGQDLSNLNLSTIYSANDSNDLINQVYSAIAKVASTKSKTVTTQQIADDPNLSVKILNSQGEITSKTQIRYQDELTLSVNANLNDLYFLPIKKDFKFKLSKININKLNYSATNFNYTNGGTFKLVQQNSAQLLANSYNAMFKTKISATDIINDLHLTWSFYDQDTKVTHNISDVLNYDDNYQVLLKVTDTDKYFNNNSKQTNFTIASFCLNPNNIANKFDLSNITNLSSPKNLYDQVYTNLVNEYNSFYQGKRNPITISTLESDSKLQLNIVNQTTLNTLSKTDTSNDLTIKTNYQVKLNVEFNDKYFQMFNIDKQVEMGKINNLDSNYFNLIKKDALKYNYKTISSLRAEIYQELLNYYNSKLDPNFAPIKLSDLINDKNLTIRIANPQSSLPNAPINYNQNLKVYVNATASDLYFKPLNNFLLYTFVFKKINLASTNSINWFLNGYHSTKDNKHITMSDAKNWLVNYVNSAKLSSKQLSWADIAPFANSIGVKNTIWVFGKPTPKSSFVQFDVTNSPYLKSGTYKLYMDHIVCNPLALTPITGPNENWSYTNLQSYTKYQPTVWDGSLVIGCFKLAQQYNSDFTTHSHTTQPPRIGMDQISPLLLGGNLEFIWYANGKWVPDGQVLQKTINDKPIQYTIYAKVTSYSNSTANYFTLTNSTTFEVVSFHFSY